MPIVKSGTIRTTVNCSLAYILNPDKTEDLLYTSSLNCMTNARDAYLNMKMVYEQFSGRSFDEPIPEKGKARVKAIHYIQSFSPDENITPEQAHRIAKAFVLKTFGEECQAVIATHVDKSHIHSHIILNTYSITGQKFNDNMTTRNRVREYSDRVCLAFGIQPIQKSKTTKGSTYGEWNHKRKGTSWKEKIRIEIDGLIGSVKNLDELLAALEERGYVLKKGKHISVKAPGQQRAVRLENLGEAYIPESLDIRIHYAEVGSDFAYPDENSELRNAYEYVLGKVTRLAEQGEKVQRKRDRSAPYSPQNDLDIYKLSAQLTVINRDRLHSIGEVEGKIAAFKTEYEKARQELNKLTAQLEKLDSLLEQAEHYFSLMHKGENVSETDRLLIAMEGETLQRNHISSREDYLRINELRKTVCSQVSALKEQFNHAKHYYDVYNDIAKTYHDISEGDYISRLINEKKQEEERQKQIAAKKRSR